MKTTTVLGAIEGARWSRSKPSTGFRWHSGESSQFRSIRHGERLAETGPFPLAIKPKWFLDLTRNRLISYRGLPSGVKRLGAWNRRAWRKVMNDRKILGRAGNLKL